MKTLFAIFSLAVLLSSCRTTSVAQSQQETTAPFRSWANVKQRFKAAGDGKKDDTRALQMALDSLTDSRFGVNTRPATAYTVIYLPRGTYRITSTLKLADKIGISIIGEDPDNTIILWDGPAGSNLLYSNGASYFKIARIQWQNARTTGNTGIAIRWGTEKNSANSYAPQMIEIAECIFRQGFAYGIAGGVFREGEHDYNNSEVSIRNCHFYNCTDAGIGISGYNALNYWIWNSRFEGCNIGVKNRFGNYHIYSSYFKRSALADVFNHHGYYTSIRKCYSDSSKYFSLDDGFSCNYFIRVLEGNYVSNSIDFPVEYSDYGFLTLVDNYFLPNTNTSWPFSINIVKRNAVCKEGPYKVFSLRNYYEYPKPFNISRTLYKQFDYSVGDYGFGAPRPRINVRAMLDSILIPFSKEIGTTVFEVPLNATADDIQKIVNTASSANYEGKRPVVHFSTGAYYIDKTIVIPANSSVQIKGDGFMYSTRIYQSRNFKGQYLFEVKGPSKATFADIHLGTEGVPAPNGILLSGIDQPQSFVLIDQMVAGPHANAIVAEKLQHTYIQKTNSYYAYRDSIIGAATPSKSMVQLFGGQFGFTSLSGHANYLAKDCWFEWADTSAALSLQGPSRLVLDACRIASSSSQSGSLVRTRQFTGLLGLLNVYSDNFLNIIPESPAYELFVMNSSTERMSVQLRSPKTARSKVALIGVSVRNKENTEEDIKLQSELNPFMSRVMSYSSGKLPRFYTYTRERRTEVNFSRVSFGNVKQAFRLTR
jgi:hypothetical protein